MNHKKLLYLFFSLLVGVSGCTYPDKLIPPEPFQPYNSNDPIARALGMITQPYPSHGEFDVGVVIERHTAYFDSNTISYVGMAFDTNGIPVKADSAYINGHELTWNLAYPPDYLWDVFCDTIGNATFDSISFRYVNFNGESYSGTTQIVPSFTNVIFPDTISASQGFHISYSNPIPNDSVILTLQFSNATADSVSPTIIDTLPDIGSVFLDPRAFPQDPSISRIKLDLYREKLIKISSSLGNRIGVLSTMTEFGFAVVKP